MECERVRASAVWNMPPAAGFLRPEAAAAALFLRDDGGYAAGGQGGAQGHYYAHGHHHQQQAPEFVEGCAYKGYGGGDDFSIDDLLDLGDGGGAGDEAAAAATENAGVCEGGAWGKASSGSHSNSGVTSEAGAADAEPLVPQVGDITDLEWVSRFVDDSYAYTPPCPVLPPAYAVTKVVASKHEAQQHRPLQFVPNPTSGASHSRSPSAGSVASITSPVAGVCSLSLKRPWPSALEEPHGSPAVAAAAVPCRKARSKRCRTGGGARAWALSAGSLFQEPLCSSASSSSSCSSTSSSFSSRLVFDQSYGGGGPFDLSASPAQPRPRGRPPLHKKKYAQHAFGGAGQVSSDSLQWLLREKPLKQKKKKGRKPKPASPFASAGLASVVTAVACEPNEEGSAPGTGRRCSHCGVQKTPQWRAGPMGAKTLCNACGVRYKSGRLLPEYRPACSPTFMSHVHSNSHRKVLEMRRHKEMMQQQDNEVMVQHQRQHQQQQQEQQLLALSASAVAAAAVTTSPPPPQSVVTAQAMMPAQQMVC